MSLFSTGMFTSHSGKLLQWKINAETLTYDDLKALAAVAGKILPPFSFVHGIPTGGLPMAEHMAGHYQAYSKRLLIVDDVLTTGASMEEARTRLLSTWPEIIGLVIFARGPCPDWVIPMFTLNESMWR